MHKHFHVLLKKLFVQCLRLCLLRTYPQALYRGTSLIRNSDPLGPYRMTMPRALRWPWGRVGLSYDRGTPVASHS